MDVQQHIDPMTSTRTAGRIRVKVWHAVAASMFSAIYAIANLALDAAARSGDTLYNYALATSLLEGNGYGLAAIHSFPDKLSGAFWIVDTFRAPLAPMIYAFLGLLAGQSSYFADTIFNILITAILLPILAYLLGEQIFRSRQVGLTAACLMALHPLFLEASLSASHDLIVTALLLVAFLFFLKGLSRPIMLVPCGLVLGLAYLGKESSALWVVAFACAALAVSVARRLPVPIQTLKYGVAGAVLFAILASSWTIRNEFMVQGNRLDKSSVGGIALFGGADIIHAHRVPMWWRPPGPSIAEAYLSSSPIDVAGTTLYNASIASTHLFLGVFVPGYSDINLDPEFSLPYYGLSYDNLKILEGILRPATGAEEGQQVLPLFSRLVSATSVAAANISWTGVLDTIAGRSLYSGILGLLALAGFWKFRRHASVMMSLMVLAVTLGIMSLLTHSIVRYYFFHFALVSVIAAATLQTLAVHWRRAAVTGLAVSFLVGAVFLHVDWHNPPAGSIDAIKLALRIDRRDTGLWLSQQPERQRMVVMSDAPLWLYAYSRVPSVVVPYSPVPERQMEVLVDVMQVYGVTHVVVPKIDSPASPLFTPLREAIKGGGGWLVPARDGDLSTVYRVEPANTPIVQITGRKLTPEEMSR